MGRGLVAAAVVALLAGGCGGGGSAPTVPGTTPAVPSKVVTLDSGNFEALVLTSGRPSVVEFLSPT
jgi:hypothetical protein